MTMNAGRLRSKPLRVIRATWPSLPARLIPTPPPWLSQRGGGLQDPRICSVVTLLTAGARSAVKRRTC